MTRPASAAIETARNALDPLREACLAAQSAANRARGRMPGSAHPLPAVALAAWHSARTLAWRALADVYEGIADARQLPDVGPTRVGDIPAGLRAARADAERAATLAGQAREQIAIAQSWVRVAAADPRARAAADRWAIAIAQLDLVAERLAVGGRALDAYANEVAGEGVRRAGQRTARGAFDGVTGAGRSPAPPR